MISIQNFYVIVKKVPFVKVHSHRDKCRILLVCFSVDAYMFVKYRHQIKFVEEERKGVYGGGREFSLLIFKTEN